MKALSMNKNHSRVMKYFLLVLLTALLSCTGEGKPTRDKSRDSTAAKAGPSSPIANYVVEVFEDSKGNLWFGTMSKGVARYNPNLEPGIGPGNRLAYFTESDGLGDNTVAHIAEDREGNLWFATHGGLTKYDGKAFTNLTTSDGLVDNRVSQVMVDGSGTLWIGTWGGVSIFDGKAFKEFPLPLPEVELLSYQTTMDWVTEIMEDSQGNIWISRDGYGACRYDPAAGGSGFTHFTKKDGLCSNNVQAMTEDAEGNIWFGSRVAERDHPDPNRRTGAGGLSRYSPGESIIQFPSVEGLSKNEIYSIHADRSGNLWIGATGLGVYRYDGKTFNLYSKTDRSDLMPYGYGVQDILEDRNGTIWFGLSGGLFQLRGDSIIHVSQHDMQNRD